MKENFFPTLGAALAGVRAYLEVREAVLEEPETFWDFWTFGGGVPYGVTKNRLAKVATLKGKPQRNKGLSLTIYRMESGTYEAVAYIA